MEFGEFYNSINSEGTVILYNWAIRRIHKIGITIDELGYLVIALSFNNIDKEKANKLNATEKSGLRWALDKGWCGWTGDEENPVISFKPFYDKLLEIYEAENIQNEKVTAKGTFDFDYSKAVKELEKLKGALGLSIREQQFIQELNIKYGWNTDFIVTFLRLVFSRDIKELKNYRPIAQSINRLGILTVDALVSYMDDVDWISKKAQEIKKDYLGLYGMLTVTEREYYVKWHVAWKMSAGVIELAARKTSGVANGSFKYMDKILGDWHNQEVTTIEEANKAMENRVAAKEAEKSVKIGVNNKKNANSNKTSSGWSGYED